MITQHSASTAGNSQLNPPAGTSDEFEVCLIGPDHPRRVEAETFIRERFSNVHDANIKSFMPSLIVLVDANDLIKSAVGVRGAGGSRLFLEHYLQVPVEQAIADATADSQETRREQIVEVGNLASSDRHATRRLFEFLALHLIRSGYRWVVFTGCSSLRHVFKRMHLKLTSLANASQQQLPRELGSWGHYYDHHPRVMAGALSDGLALAQRAQSGTARGLYQNG